MHGAIRRCNPKDTVKYIMINILLSQASWDAHYHSVRPSYALLSIARLCYILVIRKACMHTQYGTPGRRTNHCVYVHARDSSLFQPSECSGHAGTTNEHLSRSADFYINNFRCVLLCLFHILISQSFHFKATENL